MDKIKVAPPSGAPKARSASAVRKEVGSPPAANGEPLTLRNGVKHWNVDESIGYLVRKLTLSLQRHTDLHLHARDLTHSQWAPLLMLANGKGDTASALARELSIDNGAMTRMIDRLEAKDLIRRVWCKQDRRIAYLELTEQGQTIVASIPDTLAKVLDDHLRGFSRDETAQLKDLVRRMLANGDAALISFGPDTAPQGSAPKVSKKPKART